MGIWPLRQTTWCENKLWQGLPTARRRLPGSFSGHSCHRGLRHFEGAYCFLFFRWHANLWDGLHKSPSELLPLWERERLKSVKSDGWVEKSAKNSTLPRRRLQQKSSDPWFLPHKENTKRKHVTEFSQQKRNWCTLHVWQQGVTEFRCKGAS